MKLRSSAAAALLAAFLAHCQKPVLDDMTGWYDGVLTDAAAKRASPGERAGDAIAACQEDNEYRIGETEEDPSGSLKAKLQGKHSGEWKMAILQADPSGKLERGVALVPTEPPESALPQDLSDQSLANLLAQRTAALGRQGKFSGIAAIGRDRAVIASASAGFADRAKKTPFTLDSQFTLGSLGKMFTGAAVAQLVDQGKLSLDDTVGKIFPAYPNKTVRDKVTVAMLLSHTSGMGDFLARRTPAMMKNGIKRAEELMPLYDKDEPAFEPGTRWAYSNAGLALMGAIVEKRSGQTYADYIRAHIFKPAGMKHSDPNNIPHKSAALVTPYTRMSMTGAPLSDWQEAERDIGSPAGGAISTARDMLLFADALRSGKLFSKKMFAEMARNRNPQAPKGDGYGYAMGIRSVYGVPTYGHGGGFPGVNTELTFLADSPYASIVLANQDPPAAEGVNVLTAALIVEKAKRQDQAPDLAFTDLLQAPEGTKVDWPSLRGKTVLVNFWATWCVPCVAEFPLLNDLVKAADPAKVQLIAIDYGGESKEKVAGFLEKHPISAWVGIDTAREMQKRFGVNAVPVTFVIGADGHIIHRMEYPETLTAEQLTALTEGRPVTFDGAEKASAAQLDEQKKQAAEAEKAKIASLRATDGKILFSDGAKLVLAEAASAPDDGMPADLARNAFWEPGRYNLVDARLQDLVADAFHIEATRIVLSGVSSDKRYNLHLDMAGAKPEELRAAIEDALAKGLHVKAGPRTREEQVLLLGATAETASHLDKGAPPPPHYCFFNPVPPDKAVSCVAGSFDKLAGAIEDALQIPVLDETGQSGTVTATLPLAPAGRLVKSLGLTLTPAKRPLEMMVVDAAP